MIWGAISRRGKINMRIVEDSQKYLEILQNNLIDKSNELYGLNCWRFQQDNAPAHKSYLIKEWLANNVATILNHPPQSPDLNPIQNLWSLMKTRIEKNLPELKLEIAAAWESITNETINNCIDHLRNIIPEVIKNNNNNFIFYIKLLVFFIFLILKENLLHSNKIFLNVNKYFLLLP